MIAFYIKVLLSAAKRAEEEAHELGPAGTGVETQAMRPEVSAKLAEAASKRAQASQHLAAYKELVADCQSPRFLREAADLETLVGQ